MTQISNSLRLFFAIWPDEHNRTVLAENAWHLADATQGRAIARDNLHLTLIFLGEQPVEKLELITAAADRVRTHSFELICDKLRHMADQSLIWTGVSHPDPEFSLLRETLAQELAVREVSIDKRRFKPHVTLVRHTKVAPEEIDFLPVRWEVRGFSLVASNLLPTGPRYQILREWELLPPKPKTAERIIKLGPNVAI